MRLLITAGPTREFFDTVRFISNPSTGKMGYALAEAALERGHQVVLVSGPVQLPDPPGAEVIRVVSAAHMAGVCKGLWLGCDAGILTAAVCDYRPSRALDHKLKKKAADRRITLVPTEDIAAALGRTKEHRPLIGFAMEDHDHHAHAEAKLKRKRCDAIVLNGPENVAADTAVVEILTAGGGWSPPFRGSKRRIAERIVKLVESLASTRRGPSPGAGC
jgi:phosphopantothenoylcysteine decarboxylase/phosphopantothenate--cysteine ligase